MEFTLTVGQLEQGSIRKPFPVWPCLYARTTALRHTEMLAIERVFSVPVNYANGFTGSRDRPHRPPGRAWRRSRPICQLDLSGIKTCAFPRRFSHNPLLPLSSLATVPCDPPSCLRPRYALLASTDARSPPEEYDAASEKIGLLSPPALVRATILLAVSLDPPIIVKAYLSYQR